jgi:two-component system NarL family sensor kinase
MLHHVFNSGGNRRLPALFLAATFLLLLIAVVGVLWRAAGPSDGTMVNIGDTAASSDGVIVKETTGPTPLRVGDRIVAINGRPLAESVAHGVGGAPVEAGTTLPYDILREGAPVRLEITLHRFGVADAIWVGWPTLLVTIVLLGTALAIFAVSARERAAHAGIFASAIGVSTVAFAGYFPLEAVDLVAGDQFWRWYTGELLFALLWGGMLHFALSFPEFTGRGYRTRVIAGYAGTLVLYPLVAGFGFLTVDDPLERLAIVGSPALAALVTYPALIISVLLVKYVRNSDPMLRRRLRWLATALGGGAALYLGMWIIPIALTGGSPIPLQYHTLAFLPVPLAVAVAIQRHQALNIEVVVGRTLVYGSLTIGLLALYIGLVSLMSVAFGPGNHLWEQALAAALIAMAAHPLHSRLQSMINTTLFGERSDPYHVVSALASKLEHIHTPAEQLPAMVETIGTALRLPYVAIELDREAGSEKAASFGTPTTLSHRLPLTYQGELVGQLVIARRGARQLLGRKERSMLAEVARHAGTVVHTARLTTDLVRSRDRLVRAREEERRRLLRELHDGVGSTLAAVNLGLHAGRRTLGGTPSADMLFDRLSEALAGAVTEIRRLAHDLRPPALEKLGLLGAIREYITSLESPELEIVLEAPESLPALPPTVDVAAYRIVCEALTNVCRHAKARHCTVRVRVTENLRIDVIDDGVGLGSRTDTGIGLGSMRERAAELGGEFKADEPGTGGTAVCAILPLPGEG